MNSFKAAIKERFCLNPNSEKKTFHIVFDLEGSGITYSVGDCLGVYPENLPEYVEQILSRFQATGQEIIQNRDGVSFTSYDFLLKHANLLRLPKEELDFQAFCRKLSPLLPRYYSIASSMNAVKNEAHLTVALSKNPDEAPTIYGTCSHYLCVRAPIQSPQISIFHKSSHNFSLPPESHQKPIIMVGPGTGVAPFRGFMQERLASSQSDKNWLFFGERESQKDFYYKDFWESLSAKAQLVLDLAFSRDQAEKIYVQHRMLEKGRQLWQWLQEGAYLFVCGDASNMAKDVDRTLHQIVEKEGNLTPPEAKEYIKNLKKINRYQRDVY